jgi:hypothetical protein
MALYVLKQQFAQRRQIVSSGRCAEQRSQSEWLMHPWMAGITRCLSSNSIHGSRISVE